MNSPAAILLVVVFPQPRLQHNHNNRVDALILFFSVSPSSSPCSWLCIPYRFYTYSSIFFYNLKRDKQNTLIRVAAFDMEVTGAVGPPIQSQIYKHKRNKVCKRTQTRACFHTHNTNERGSSLERLSP